MACTTPLDVYSCETNLDCASAEQRGGECEPNKLCSFSDPSCSGEGQRYGTGSGELSNQCVGEDVPTDLDGSTLGPASDAGIDAAPTLNDAAIPRPDGPPPSCANISMTVFDNNDANDKLKIRVGDVDIHICQGVAVPPGTDTIKQCTFCVDEGTDVKLSWYEGVDRLTDFTTNCQAPCPFGAGQLSCDFTVTEACSATVVFDVDFSTP